MTKPRPHRPLNPQIRNEAAAWLLRFSEEEVDAAGREEFSDWLRTSPEHLRAYLRVSAFWQEAGNLDGGKQGRDIEALVARAKREANVFPLAFGVQVAETDSAQGAVAPVPVKKVSSGVSRVRRLAAVAAVAIAVVGSVGVYQHLTHDVYETRVGEQRIVNLPDGSTIVLNADSQLRVRYSRADRVIQLYQGQALFKVAKNAARPFIVMSGEARVRAVGTEFDVYRRSTGTTVTVVEGKVATTHHELSPVFLQAGEQLTIPEVIVANVDARSGAPATPASRVHPVRIEDATAWTAGLLVFDGAPLAEVIREFNRQNAKQIVLEPDPELAQLKISGTFPANGAGRITKFLHERFGVVVAETDSEIRLSR